MNFIKSLCSFFSAIGDALQPVLLLLLRVYWGYAFHLAGCQKFGNLDATAEFFAGIGIPLPGFNAFLVAIVECVGGWMLILGFFSRLASLPLIVAMVTALGLAHTDGATQVFSNPSAFIGEAPVSFLMVSLIVFCFGSGKISLDYLIDRFYFKKEV